MAKTPLDWAEIRAEITRRGATFDSLAKDNGVSRSLLTHTKTRPNRRAEAIIAAFIDREPAELWPERYQKPERPPIGAAYKQLVKENSGKAVNKRLRRQAA